MQVQKSATIELVVGKASQMHLHCALHFLVRKSPVCQPKSVVIAINCCHKYNKSKNYLNATSLLLHRNMQAQLQQ